MAEPSLAEGSAPSPDTPAGYPFRGPGLLARVAPFAGVALLAEASLALPPGPTSGWAVLISVLLLAAVPATVALPWERLPARMPVLVPLIYTGSVLALILGAGTTSGVGIAILIPLVWTALFHRWWESACIVVAIVIVEVVISLTPAQVPDAVIARRVLLWACIGVLVSVATHGLRDRIQRTQEERARLENRLRQLTIIQDRDRIAADLQDKVIQQIFVTGIRLQGAATLAAEPEVRSRVEASVNDLDQVVRMLRDTIFGLQRRMTGRGLRQELLELCADLSPAPEISFSGPVDGALHPGAKVQLVDMLRQALTLIGPHAARIDIAAGDHSCVTVIEATPGPYPAGPYPAAANGAAANGAAANGAAGNGAAGNAGAWGNEGAGDLSGLRDIGARAGVRVDIDPIPGGIRLAWDIPLNPGLSGARCSGRCAA